MNPAAIVSALATSARSDFALSVVKQTAESSQMLVDLLQVTAQRAKAMLNAGAGSNLDILA